MDWFYRLDGQEEGPITEDDLKHVFESGALPLTTQVWSERQKEWCPASDCSEFANDRSSTKNAVETKQPFWKTKLGWGMAACCLLIGGFLAFPSRNHHPSSPGLGSALGTNWKELAKEYRNTPTKGFWMAGNEKFELTQNIADLDDLYFDELNVPRYVGKVLQVIGKDSALIDLRGQIVAAGPFHKDPEHEDYTPQDLYEGKMVAFRAVRTGVYQYETVGGRVATVAVLDLGYPVGDKKTLDELPKKLVDKRNELLDASTPPSPWAFEPEGVRGSGVVNRQ